MENYMYAAEHHKEHKVHHPAHNMYVVTIICVAIVVLFGFITVFVPWAMKDIGVGQRAWAFPFKTCIENTFSDVNEETCIDNDFIEPQGVPLTGANAECKAYILATIAMVFISVLLGVICLLLIGYMLEHMWWVKMWLAVVVQVLLIIVCIATFLSWGFFIVYAEMTCVEGSIFPVHGYSYGFIMYLFATPFAITAVVTGFLGMKKIKAYKKMEKEMGMGEMRDNQFEAGQMGTYMEPEPMYAPAWQPQAFNYVTPVVTPINYPLVSSAPAYSAPAPYFAAPY